MWIIQCGHPKLNGMSNVEKVNRSCSLGFNDFHSSASGSVSLKALTLKMCSNFFQAQVNGCHYSMYKCVCGQAGGSLLCCNGEYDLVCLNLSEAHKVRIRGRGGECFPFG